MDSLSSVKNSKNFDLSIVMTTDEKNSQNPKDYDKILRLKRILHGIKDGLYLTAMNL